MDTSYMVNGMQHPGMDYSSMYDPYMHKPQYSSYDTMASQQNTRVAAAMTGQPLPSPRDHQVAQAAESAASPPHPQTQGMPGQPGQLQQMYSHQSHHPGNMGAHPHFPPQHMYIPPISHSDHPVTTDYSMGHPNMLSPNAPVYTTPHVMAPRQQMQMAAYYQQAPPVGNGTSPVGSGGSPSPGSEDSLEEGTRQNKRPPPDTGEIGGVGGAAGSLTGAGRGKKQKVSKKNKKKKDPNEPHKPVSAYALFFRDTQASIRGQSPNASFGEVSKIVASLWDGLDAERKNVYKKKTELAKKEYLKQLAAYRASLVSKGGEGENKYPPGSQAPPQSFPPHYPSPYGGSYPGGLNPHSQAPPHGMQGHSIPPQQPSPHAPSPHMNPMMDGASLVNPPMTQAMPPSGTPLMTPHNPNMGGQMPPQPQPYMAQQASPGMGSPVSSLPSASPSPLQTAHPAHSPHIFGGAPPPPQQQQHSPPQHYTANPQQQAPPQSSPDSQQQSSAPPPQSSPHSSPTPSGTSTSPSSSSPGGSGVRECTNGANTQQQQTGGVTNCIRSGCVNPAVQCSEWENEYCSNECVVNHCRDVFSTWVTNNQNPSSGYPASVK